MKRTRMLSILLAVLLVFLFSAAVLAAEPMTVTVETKADAVQVGDEVSLAVSIAGNPGFTNYQWTLEYDADSLEVKKVENKLNGLFETREEIGRVNIGLIAANPISEDGTAFVVTFLVKQGAAEGLSEVKISSKKLANVPEKVEAIDAQYIAGGVTIASTTGGSTTGGSTTGGSTTGGSTTGGSTTGGSTTGGSTTGGSATGGSTTGGSTTGGSTTGGSTTGGSTTGGSTTGGSTTGGSTTGGSTTGGSTTGGSTTGGSTTGGSTTGGSTTGGSTTGGSTTGGSTTGGSTTGGSTTGGSTTGGSTTGGSTTGGSTTGGSTTGGSTTGGSTTGGSTTGGSTTGGSTTGSGRMVELVGGNSSATYKVTGNTLNVQNDAACVVLYTIDNGETYTKLAATANEAGGYDFDLTNVPANAVIKIAIQGDFNMDGSVDALDAVMVNRAAAGLLPHNELQSQIGHVGGSDALDGLDALLINRSAAGKYTIAW